MYAQLWHVNIIIECSLKTAIMTYNRMTASTITNAKEDWWLIKHVNNKTITNKIRCSRIQYVMFNKTFSRKHLTVMCANIPDNILQNLTTNQQTHKQICHITPLMNMDLI